MIFESAGQLHRAGHADIKWLLESSFGGFARGVGLDVGADLAAARQCKVGHHNIKSQAGTNDTLQFCVGEILLRNVTVIE